MRRPFDDSIAIAVTRADSYLHVDGVNPHPRNPVLPLEVTQLRVYPDAIEERRVTISAAGADPDDPYGFEVDLELEAARLLALQLVAAAAASEAAANASASSEPARPRSRMPALPCLSEEPVQ